MYIGYRDYGLLGFYTQTMTHSPTFGDVIIAEYHRLRAWSNIMGLENHLKSSAPVSYTFHRTHIRVAHTWHLYQDA